MRCCYSPETLLLSVHCIYVSRCSVSLQHPKTTHGLQISQLQPWIVFQWWIWWSSHCPTKWLGFRCCKMILSFPKHQVSDFEARISKSASFVTEPEFELMVKKVTFDFGRPYVKCPGARLRAPRTLFGQHSWRLPQFHLRNRFGCVCISHHEIGYHVCLACAPRHSNQNLPHTLKYTGVYRTPLK